MTNYSIEHFASDTPPERIMGTETEYMVPETSANYSGDAVVSAGIKMYGTKIGQQALKNGGRIYRDVNVVEYATPECLGPKQTTFAEMAGERIVKASFDAVFGPERALYRRTGAYGTEGFRSVGYHQNLLTPPRASSSEQMADAHVLGSYAAARVILTGAGMLDKSRYGFSQKAQDVNPNTVSKDGLTFAALHIGDYGGRMNRGSKPILSWSRHNGGSMESHADYWTRLEFRYVDAVHSPYVREASLATASLTLRLLEHRHLFAEGVWDELIFKDLGPTVRAISEDTTLSRIYETRAGTRTTALALSRRLASMSLELAEVVRLPDDERTAARDWLEISEELEAHDDLLEAAQAMRDRLEWAGRLHMLDRRRTKLGVDAPMNRHSVQLAAADLVWDRIHPTAMAERYWRRKQADFFAAYDRTIDEHTVIPPDRTRANIRGMLLRRDYGVRNGVWNGMLYPDGRPFALPNPYRYAV